VAQIEHDAVTGAARTYAVHTDAIGLPRAMTSPTGATVWSASVARPYGDITETTTPDPETGKTVVTNLRLPGQYDERLLASVGLQGPYYNWNRWYLPSVGRYLELDPIAKAGGFNGEYGPDWYSYASGNPLSFTDRRGLCVEDLCVVEGAVIGGLAELGILGMLWDGWNRNKAPPPPQPVPCHGGPGPQGPPTPNPAPVQPKPMPSHDTGGGGGGREPPDRCRDQYNNAAGQCADWYTSADDTQYNRCMDQAWKNYIRCLNGLPWEPMR
jgi:RHS repeat-associated protein